MNLADQRAMMERALGERMLNHVFYFLRQWAKELGFDPYADRIHSLSQSYNQLFDYYLSADDPERENIHAKLTTETYRLTDEMYGAIRLRRGIVVGTNGFERNSMQSIMRYFSTCQHFQDEDLDWLCETANDPEKYVYATAAVSALGLNLRESFQEEAILALIQCISAESELLSMQALHFVILLLAQWDSRIDYFPNIQDAFEEQISEGEEAYMALESIVKHARLSLRELMESSEAELAELPKEIQNMIKQAPDTDSDYLQLVVELLPETWIFDLIVGEDEERNARIEEAYLQLGSMSLMWDRVEDAEEWLVERLRSGKATVMDYINYGHCCFLRGDRLMAYENYREAKRQCKTNKEFFDIFRPDRKMLIEKGIALEQVYLMEDQLLR